MTTFQNPPPQSRRSARQTERGGPVDGVENADFSQVIPPAQAQPQAQPYPSQQYPSQQYPAPSFQEQLQPDSASNGRRARGDAAQDPYGAPPEPLNYTTQGAPYTAQQASPSYGAAPTAFPGQDSAAYRVRDFSPESGRRAGAPPLVEPPASAGYDASAGDINYQTQGYGAAGTTAAAAPIAPASRREQRQRQADQQAATGQLTGQFASQSTGGLAYNPGLLAQTQQQAPSLAPQQAQQPQSLAQPVQGQQSPQQPPVQAGYPQYPSGEVVTGYPAAPERAQPAPTALSNAIIEFEALTRNGQPPGPPAAQRVPDS